MSVKESVYKIFDENSDKERKEALAILMSKFKISYKTAEAYYTAWKKEYMKTKFQDEAVKDVAADKVEKIEKQDAPEEKKKDWFVKPCEKEIVKIEVVKEVNPFEGFMPLALKGQHGVYSFDNEGVSINSLEKKHITRDSVTEQLKAVKLWENHYKVGE